MNATDLAALLNELPDDMIVSANTAHYEKPNRIRMFLPTAAVIAAALTAAALYPLFRTQEPEMIPPDHPSVTELTSTGTDVTTSTAALVQSDRTDSTTTVTVQSVSDSTAANAQTTVSSTTQTTASVTLQTAGSAQSTSSAQGSTTAEVPVTLSSQSTAQTTQSATSPSDCTVTSSAAVSEESTILWEFTEWPETTSEDGAGVICDTTTETTTTTTVTEQEGSL